MLSHHQNEIVECRIKELTLGSWTPHPHINRLWTQTVITMRWPFSFNTVFQIYNRMDMDKERKAPEQKFVGVDFQIPQQTIRPGVALS